MPPSFDIPLKPMTVNEEGKLTLRCHVRGSPPLRIAWMKDRRELSSSTNTKITFVDGTATLEILRMSKGDAGDYLCKATNEAGSEFCKSKVTVQGILEFIVFKRLSAKFGNLSTNFVLLKNGNLNLCAVLPCEINHLSVVPLCNTCKLSLILI